MSRVSTAVMPQAASGTRPEPARRAGLRDFLVLFGGQVVSAIGSRLSTFALGIWVLRTTGSTTDFALTYLAMDLPLLLVSPLAGVAADRLDRRRLMMACVSVGALAMFALASLLALHQLALWHVYVGVAVISICQGFHSPTFAASIPLLVDEKQLPRVNGLVQTGSAIATIVGPLLAGVLVNTIALQGVLAVDGATFLVALAGIALSHVPRPPKSAQPAAPGLGREAAAGWRYVRSREGLVGLLVVEALQNFIFSIAGVLITPLLLSFASPALVGLQFAIGGAGLLLGGLALAAVGAPKRKVPAMLACMALAGVMLAAHGLRPSFTLVSVAGFLMFASMPIGEALNVSLWQTKVPSELQGRCFAIKQMLSNGLSPIGYALAGPLAEHVFEPLLAVHGPLAAWIGPAIGTGPGRGTGLLFIVLGSLMSLVPLAAFGAARIRRVDDLPDAFALAAQGEATPASCGHSPTPHPADHTAAASTPTGARASSVAPLA